STIQQVSRFRNNDTLFPYVLHVNPASWPIALNYGICLKKAGRLNDAARTVEDLLEVMPNLPQANAELGEILAARGDHAGAAACYQRAIAFTSPPDHKLFVKMGQQLIDSGQYGTAAGVFQQAVTLSPVNEEAQQGLGIALGNSGDRPHGIEHLRLAVTLNPLDTRALDNLGILLAESGFAADAIQAWTAATLADPNYAKAHSNLAAGLEIQHRPAEALAQFEDVLRLEPGNTRALAGVARLRITRIRRDARP
ncbi:MAG: tetratricopeptide repeat protein, partial [Capsulimonadaceae bacterium]